MKQLLRVATILAGLLAASVLYSSPAVAAPAPAWSLRLTPMPANFTPGGHVEYVAAATNVGAAATTGPVTLELSLPPDLTATSAIGRIAGKAATYPCTVTPSSVSCVLAAALPSGGRFWAQVKVDVAAGPTAASTTILRVAGGGAAEATVTAAPPLQAAPVPFDFLESGLQAPNTEEDGSPALLAGSHPYQQTVSFGFPTEQNGTDILTNAGHPHDAFLDLPPGLVGNPAATPQLCTEVQLYARKCPAASQIGIFEVTTLEGDSGVIGLNHDPIYNMVPPPGQPAELATDIGGIGIFPHLFANVRSDGDYGIEVTSPDILALGTTPIFEIQTQVWSDASDPAHGVLGQCPGPEEGKTVPCPLPPQADAFWTMPTSCDGQPDTSTVRADSWEQRGDFMQTSYQSADLAGSPVAVSGCGALDFQPTIEATPTTNLADSPAGLDVRLHQPQQNELGHRATAQLRDARVTLPDGMAVNPSQADGLSACSEAEIGYLSEAEGIHFSKDPAGCPDAAKLGTVAVDTPLLVQRDDEHKLVLNPETGQPEPETLHGSVYLAEPFDNPFGSLLAIYLDVEDPATGIVAKLAGRVEADPVTGRLTTIFEENPQLPIEDIELHLFGGPRGALITPPVCGSHTTTTTLTPWSSPEGADAHPQSAFQTSAAPGGGACPATPEAAPNAPTFTAGTLNSQAGAYAPFVLKLSREDGTQRLTGFDSLLPPGLTGKLAGIAECSDAALAQAAGRSRPNEGILERRSPSCPGSSALGTVTIAAGAGPTPFYTNGTAYLAGPYKGAPLSMAVITPAIAGPFDLGVVVVRAALYVDPGSARIHAVSDSFPTILQGIPLDLRSVAVKLDRPSFTLNPTSCDPMQITGSAIAAVGAPASLVSPFQVGGCSSLAFKPKLKIKLKGGTARSENPALRATLTMPPAGANIARASVVLPHSEFLDQAHIRTVCTRVQFAAAGGNGAACPAGSVYGRARAVTPLLDSPLEGPVFLRSSNHLLPDLVAALHGQIDVDLVGRIDSHKGGIRTTFEGVPDAPVSKFVLEMQGGRKGLLDNSVNLCRRTNRATALFDGQNGKVGDSRPVVGNDCKRKPKRGRGKKR